MDRWPRPLANTVMIATLTVALGATVALAWLAFGGSASFRGPIRALEESWPLIYGGQALFAAAVGFVAGRPIVETYGWWRGSVVAILAAWVGEWVVLFFAGTLFAGELVPQVAWFYWLIGTGGPLQPAAALAGVWLASRRRTPQAPMAEATSSRPS